MWPVSFSASLKKKRLWGQSTICGNLRLCPPGQRTRFRPAIITNKQCQTHINTSTPMSEVSQWLVAVVWAS